MAVAHTTLQDEGMSQADDVQLEAKDRELELAARVPVLVLGCTRAVAQAQNDIASIVSSGCLDRTLMAEVP